MRYVFFLSAAVLQLSLSTTVESKEYRTYTASSGFRMTADASQEFGEWLDKIEPNHNKQERMLADAKTNMALKQRFARETGRIPSAQPRKNTEKKKKKEPNND